MAENKNAFMGDLNNKFARALYANAERDRDLRDTSKTLQALTAKFTQETTFLSGLESRLEERDERSKWDFATLAAGMVIAALLAGGGAVFFTKQNLDTANFADAVRLIQNDDRNYWCGTAANAPLIQYRDGTQYCAIAKPRYQVPEEPAADLSLGDNSFLRYIMRRSAETRFSRGSVLQIVNAEIRAYAAEEMRSLMSSNWMPVSSAIS